jgi:hypothetical protein
MQIGGLQFLEKAVSLVRQDPVESAYAAGIGIAAALMLTPALVLSLKACVWLNKRRLSPTIRALVYLSLIVGGCVGLFQLLWLFLGDFGLLEYRVVSEQICIPVLAATSGYVFSKKNDARR